MAESATPAGPYEPTWESLQRYTVPERFKEREQASFTSADIRFTSAGDALYAICLGCPGPQCTIRSLGPDSTVRADRIAQVTMLGRPKPLQWSQGAAGLTIRTPAEKPCEHAYSFKIALKGSE